MLFNNLRRITSVMLMLMFTGQVYAFEQASVEVSDWYGGSFEEANYFNPINGMSIYFGKQSDFGLFVTANNTRQDKTCPKVKIDLTPISDTGVLDHNNAIYHEGSYYTNTRYGSCKQYSFLPAIPEGMYKMDMKHVMEDGSNVWLRGAIIKIRAIQPMISAVGEDTFVFLGRSSVYIRMQLPYAYNGESCLAKVKDMGDYSHLIADIVGQSIPYPSSQCVFRVPYGHILDAPSGGVKVDLHSNGQWRSYTVVQQQ